MTRWSLDSHTPQNPSDYIGSSILTPSGSSSDPEPRTPGADGGAMVTRRAFLHTAAAAGTALAAFRDDGMKRVAAASRHASGSSPLALAEDEAYWREIQQAFTLDRTII